jgi:hypothetical protein
MAKKSFSARIDEDIYEAIADYCEEENISQAQWLERIAKKFLAVTRSSGCQNRIGDRAIAR